MSAGTSGSNRSADGFQDYTRRIACVFNPGCRYSAYGNAVRTVLNNYVTFIRRGIKCYGIDEKRRALRADG